MRYPLFAPPVLFPLLAFLASAALAAGPSGRLNDTGQTLCHDGGGMVACTEANSGSGAALPGQDGRYGRDAAYNGALLNKTGGGAAGFDFTKICQSGQAAGHGTCAADPGVGDADPWACTRDNVTNLVWAIETMADADWATAMTNHPPTLNAAVRCGYGSGWRLPTRRELISILRLANTDSWTQTAVDDAYFPNTASNMHWSTNTYVSDTDRVWCVRLNSGGMLQMPKNVSYPSRMVHDGE